MPGSNKFVVFNPSLTNSQTDAQFQADGSVTGGLSAGLANPQMHNKLFHQVSIMAAAIGEFIKGLGGAASDVDLTALRDAFIAALDAEIAAKAPAPSLPTISITAADSPYTVPAWFRHVRVNASGGAVTVILPTAVGHDGELIEVSKVDSSANTVTIDPNGAETIDDPPASTFVLYSQGDSASCRSDNVNVMVV